ncbi:hypothetical protein ACFVH6_10145 [Spirillospora sp. NPDC127200]
MVNALDEVKCSYTGRDGRKRQTDIRIVDFPFGKGRMQLARKPTAPRKQGCWTDVVHVDPAPGKPGAAYHAAFRQNLFKIRKACGRP